MTMHWLNFLLLIVGLIMFYMLGFWTKRQLVSKGVASEKTSFGTVEGSLLALFAFFLGFTFSISASKIETVRVTSIAEANAIGTAMLRIQLYDDATQNQLLKLYKPYLRARMLYFHDQADSVALASSETDRIGREIWKLAVLKQKTGDYPAASRLMLPAINEMLDAVSTRDGAIRATLPPSIIWTLYILSFCSCFIVGFGMRKKFFNNFIGMIYIFIIALTVHLILDAADPRQGFINTKKANQAIEAIYDTEYK